MADTVKTPEQLAAEAATAAANKLIADATAAVTTQHLGFLDKLGMAFGVDPKDGAAMHVGLLILVGVGALFLLLMWKARK